MIKIQFNDIYKIFFYTKGNYSENGFPIENSNVPLSEIPLEGRKAYVLTPTHYIKNNNFNLPARLLRINGTTIKRGLSSSTNAILSYYIVFENNLFYLTNNVYIPDFIEPSTQIKSNGGALNFGSSSGNLSELLLAGDKDGNLTIFTRWEYGNLFNEAERNSIYNNAGISAYRVSKYENNRWSHLYEVNNNNDYPFHVVILLKEKDKKYIYFKKEEV